MWSNLHGYLLLYSKYLSKVLLFIHISRADLFERIPIFVYSSDVVYPEMLICLHCGRKEVY